MFTKVLPRAKSPPQETYKKVNLRKIYVYNTYISLTIYINKFQNIKGEEL